MLSLHTRRRVRCAHNRPLGGKGTKKHGYRQTFLCFLPKKGYSAQKSELKTPTPIHIPTEKAYQTNDRKKCHAMVNAASGNTLRWRITKQLKQLINQHNRRTAMNSGIWLTCFPATTKRSSPLRLLRNRTYRANGTIIYPTVRQACTGADPGRDQEYKARVGRSRTCLYGPIYPVPTAPPPSARL